ncbi:MAG TPA: hypothetical protein VMK16_15095 [Acidimicrobiales bacterium]|nr:hypothetical protein [Acidimicrobiales bacterium]
MSSTRPGYGQVDRDYAIRLATTDPADDGPIWMVNLMRYKPVATYAEGDAEGAAVSGREADDRYAPLDVLADIGAEVVFFGDVEDQLLGEGEPWERVGIVRYPTGRSFIEMQQRGDFKERHVHKEAGMERTIVMGCHPAGGDLAAPTDLSGLPDWADVPHPPTEDDGPVMVIHVTRYTEGAGRDEMRRYTSAAAKTAVPQGVRIAGWFDVDGTIVGDGREWHQVRMNRFPSKAAFMAVVRDPVRLEAQSAHREPALADTYTLVVRPQIDTLPGR